MYFKIKKRLGRIHRKYLGGKRKHPVILGKYVTEVLQSTRRGVFVETGCIRMRDEGTESTLTIASLVRDSGAFYTFELRPQHIEICKDLCGELNQYIRYIEGDSVGSLKKLVADGTLQRVDFAFLDSMNDGDHIFREFSILEASFRPGSVLVCDDVLWADKGRLLRPYLEASPDWKTHIYNVENGMMAAHRI